MPLANFLPGFFAGSGPGPFDIERPGEYTLKDFMDEGASGGIDALTTTTASLNHNGDSITLKNPYENVTAHFEIKTIKTVSELELTGWKKKPAKTYIDHVTLTTGQTWVKTLEEGTDYTPETGFLPERINRDITVTLVSYDTPEGTQYTGPGRQLFGPGGYYSVENIMDRLRNRRMFLGELGTQSGNRTVPRRVIPCPARRQNIIDMTAKGEVASPRHAGMIYAADVFEDTKANVRGGLRPY